MSHAAALFIAAHQAVTVAETYGARHYFKGMRDAFEAVFRMCHQVPDTVDAVTAATVVLDQLEPDERVNLITKSAEVLRARRAETVAETVVAL